MKKTNYLEYLPYLLLIFLFVIKKPIIIILILLVLILYSLLLYFKKRNSNSNQYDIYDNSKKDIIEDEIKIVKKVLNNNSVNMNEGQFDNNMNVEKQESFPDDYVEDTGEKKIVIGDDEIIIKSPNSSKKVHSSAPDLVITDEFINKYNEICQLKNFPESNDAQFDLIINEIVELIHYKYTAFTVGIAWYKKKAQKFEIRNYKSLTTDITEAKIPYDACLLSEVVSTQKPVVRNQYMNLQEKDLLKYYTADYYQNIGSFLGVPIYFLGSEIVGVLFIDFRNENIITRYVVDDLVAYSKIISYVLLSYHNRSKKEDYKDKFDGMQELLDLNIILDLNQQLFAKFAKNILKFVNYDFISLILFDNYSNELKVKGVYNHTPNKYIGEGARIDKNTIAYDAIINKEIIMINDLESSSYVYRFNNEENLTFIGSVLAIPIYSDYSYGCVIIENIKKNSFRDAEKVFLNKIMKFWGVILTYQNKIFELDQSIDYDLELNILKYQSFLNKVSIELEKNAVLGNIPCSIAIVWIDYSKYKEELKQLGATIIPMKYLIKVISPHLTKYDLVCKYDNESILIYFFNSDSQKTSIKLEKMRMDVSKKQCPFNNKEYLFTITAGLVNATGKIDIVNIIEDAINSLSKGLEKGGNNIQRIDF